MREMAMPVLPVIARAQDRSVGMPAAETVRIAVLDDYQHVARSFADWSTLPAHARVVFFHDHVADIDQLAARFEPFDVLVLTRERTKFDAALINRLPRLKLIVTIGMWNAAIDIAAANAQGVVVSGTTGGSKDAMPALTWGLILGLTRNLYREAASVRAGGWQVDVGRNISGRTLGVLGLGAIGREVAQIGKSFGMRPVAWSQNLDAEKAAEAGVEFVSKEELFRNSDVLTVHLKLSDRTRNIIGAAELALMKKTAFLINTSRGQLISESALVSALQERRIAGAAVDVYDVEPLPKDSPFRHLPNVLATPHVGFVTEDTYRGAFPTIVENIQAWIEGVPARVLTA
jgi:phosphoglycerate dehydrogenase-like enzyme